MATLERNLFTQHPRRKTAAENSRKKNVQGKPPRRRTPRERTLGAKLLALILLWYSYWVGTGERIFGSHVSTRTSRSLVLRRS